jgi:hypothetical protein
MNIDRFVKTAVCAMLGGTSLAVFADDSATPVHPALNDKFYFGAGVFLTTTTSSLQVNSNTGVGASIDMEKLLGLQSNKGVPDGMFRWRFTDRWRVEVEYFELNRSGTKAIDRDIQVGDTTFPVNTQMNSKFDFSDARVSVGYSFFKTVDKELGVALGAHVLSYNVSLNGTFNGNTVGNETAAVTAPLPVISGYGTFALTDRWAVDARLDRFTLSYDAYKGNMTSVAVDILYQPFRHVGFGLGYRAVYIDLSFSATSWSGNAQQSFQGPVAFVTASF